MFFCYIRGNNSNKFVTPFLGYNFLMYKYLQMFYLSRLQIEIIKTVFLYLFYFIIMWGNKVTGVKISIIH